ncbi:hypothetical protein N8447_00250 [bacterium]|jgi:hypothetical protein|nr:hypothetical protein [bacterium]|tara:strand:+ start:2344 stop:2793 length:450 start_codon:yes stop_codon:yes gene_type:complete
MSKIKQRVENTQKCEFVLKLGNNIVCQRFFSVRNFNDRATQSIDIHYVIRDIVDGIVERLKLKTLYLLESNYKENTIDEAQEDEYFTITLKKGNKVFYDTITPASIYPPKVRFTVDIRPQISSILRELTLVLSQKKVTTHYQDYNLIVN